MKIQQLSKVEYWKATLRWSPPRKWYRGEGVDLPSELKDLTGLYRLEMRHKRQAGPRRNAYIGITYDQTFEERIHSGDRIEQIDKWFPKGQLWVSVAELNLHGAKHLRTRYEEIEGILIYFTRPIKNDRKKQWAPSGYFEVKNTGYRGPLPRTIIYPVAGIEL